MELLLKDGDYVPDGQGGFLAVEGGAAMLQRALFALTVRRGSFPFLPELGSRLYLLPREKPSAREVLAQRYAVEALAGEGDLRVTGVSLTDLGDLRVTGVSLTDLGEGTLAVRVKMDWKGEDLEAEVRV